MRGNLMVCPLLFEAAGGADWSPYFGDVDEAKVKEAHALALSVVVWTVTSAKISSACWRGKWMASSAIIRIVCLKFSLRAGFGCAR